MIRINLLAVKKKKERGAGQQQIFLFLLLLAGLGMGLFYVVSLENDKIAVLETKKSGIKTEVARFEELIGDIKVYQKKKEDHQKKIDVIEMLKKRKTGPVRILDELSTVIPKKVWLTNLREGGKKLNMSGFATDNKEIAVFMKQLENSKYFSKVTLLSIKQAKLKGVTMPVMKFSMNCNYRLPQS